MNVVQWLHQLILDTVSIHLLACYLDALQTLKSKVSGVLNCCEKWEWWMFTWPALAEFLVVVVFRGAGVDYEGESYQTVHHDAFHLVLTLPPAPPTPFFFFLSLFCFFCNGAFSNKILSLYEIDLFCMMDTFWWFVIMAQVWYRKFMESESAVKAPVSCVAFHCCLPASLS